MTLQEKIDFAIKTIKGLDLANIAVGKYVVNDDFYYLIQEYDSKLLKDCKLEAHREYVDIQYVIEGKEAIDIRDFGNLEVETPYNPEKDVTFYQTPNIMERLELSAGSYAVLLPETAHKPGIAIDDKPVKIKKCVCKVRV